MTHRMRLAAVCIDCKTEDLAEAETFWSALIGAPAERDDSGRYAHIGGSEDYPHVLLQAVDHPPRVHLDFETDDREAECARLEALGARVVARIKTWIVMEAPTGHRFCLVRPQSDHFPGEGRMAAREFDQAPVVRPAPGPGQSRGARRRSPSNTAPANSPSVPKPK